MVGCDGWDAEMAVSVPLCNRDGKWPEKNRMGRDERKIHWERRQAMAVWLWPVGRKHKDGIT